MTIYPDSGDIFLDYVTWVSQFDSGRFSNCTCWKNTCCNRASNTILNIAGTSTNRTQQIVIVTSGNSNCGNLSCVSDTYTFNTAIKAIDTSLYRHNLPIMIGVHHPKIKENRLTKLLEYQDDYCAESNDPSITNHYIVIVGKYYDSNRSKYYYRFYEVGTRNIDNGRSDKNRLYIEHPNHMVKGDTEYITYDNYYTLTEVRKNIGEEY